MTRPVLGVCHSIEDRRARVLAMVGEGMGTAQMVAALQVTDQVIRNDVALLRRELARPDLAPHVTPAPRARKRGACSRCGTPIKSYGTTGMCRACGAAEQARQAARARLQDAPRGARLGNARETPQRCPIALKGAVAEAVAKLPKGASAEQRMLAAMVAAGVPVGKPA